ncbi:MAG: ATP-binding protein [Acidimicrobiia bacterium]|nr:ATP-binding protein [Acidimicrobiia bacterium]MCY4457152.1 ATP-binding protein [Acidimicrobiaceae bacterium]
MTVERDLAPQLERAALSAAAVTLTGPRQSGKTTLCRAVFADHPYVSLEAPDVRSFAVDDPRTFLAQFPRGAIIDEVQRAPDLPSYLQGLIDTDPTPGQWILAGSQNFSLAESVNQSLAGRTAVHHLLPLSRGEVVRFPHHPEDLNETLVTGGYPRIFDRGLEPSEWLGSFIATYVERDVRTLRNVGDLSSFGRFLELCAGRTAQLVNLSSLAGDCGISQPTAKAWLSILEASFVVFLLRPFHTNLRKRLVKMPKLHFYDTGLVCYLLGIRTAEQLHSHPLRGSIFETWVVSEINKQRTHQGLRRGLSFYRDRSGTEVDLVIEHPERLTLIETRSAATPSTSFLTTARRVKAQLGDQRQCNLTAVYGGDQHQKRNDEHLLPWAQLHHADPGQIR